MTRNTLAAAIQNLAPLASGDHQIRLIGEVKLTGFSVNVHTLRLSSRRTIALLTQGNRWVVLSDPGLLFDDAHPIDDQAKAAVAGFLSGNKASQAICCEIAGRWQPMSRVWNPPEPESPLV